MFEKLKKNNKINRQKNIELYYETIQRIINKGEYSINLLYLLTEIKSAISSEVISEILEIEQIKAEDAINTCREILFKNSLTAETDDYLFFNKPLRGFIQRRYPKECKEMQNKIVEFCFNYKEIKGKLSLEYALKYGIEHLYDIKDYNRIWELLKNTDYIELQIEKFKQYDPSLNALKKAIQIYIEREGATPKDDGRLCWLMLKAGKISEQAEINVNPKEVVGWMKEKAIDDPNRISNILNKIETLSEVNYFKHIVFILLIDAHKQKELSIEDRNPEFTEKILKELDKKIIKGSETIDWSNFFSADFMALIANFLFDIFPNIKLFSYVRRCKSNGLSNFCIFLISINNNIRNIFFAIKIANSIKDSYLRYSSLSHIAESLVKVGEIEKAIEVANTIKDSEKKANILKEITNEKAGERKKTKETPKMDLEEESLKNKSIVSELTKAGEIKRALEVSNNIKDDFNKSEALKNIIESLSKKEDYNLFKIFFDSIPLNSEVLYSTLLDWRLSLVKSSKKLYLKESFIKNIYDLNLNYHAVLSLLQIYIKDGKHEYSNSIIEHCPGLELDFQRKDFKSKDFKSKDLISKDYNPFEGFLRAIGIVRNKDITNKKFEENRLSE